MICANVSLQTKHQKLLVRKRGAAIFSVIAEYFRNNTIFSSVTLIIPSQSGCTQWITQGLSEAETCVEILCSL
jgi:hypothetical protein